MSIRLHTSKLIKATSHITPPSGMGVTLSNKSFNISSDSVVCMGKELSSDEIMALRHELIYVAKRVAASEKLQALKTNCVAFVTTGENQVVEVIIQEKFTDSVMVVPSSNGQPLPEGQSSRIHAIQSIRQ
jgi:hypothetical protein